MNQPQIKCLPLNEKMNFLCIIFQMQTFKCLSHNLPIKRSAVNVSCADIGEHDRRFILTALLRLLITR